MGVTTNFRESVDRMCKSGSRRAWKNTELIHIEQHDQHQLAHKRLQAIRSRWREDVNYAMWLNVNPLKLPPAVSGSISLH